jgi:plasmid stabilization system protein ParE
VKTYQVLVFPRAAVNIDAILAWIAARSPTGAKSWLAAFEDATNGLSRDPLRHALAPESQQLEEPIRERFFRTRRGHIYRILYTVAEAEVRILGVRGPGQAPVTPNDFAP